MKKSLHYFLFLVLAFFLTACQIQTVEQFEQMQEQEQSITPPAPLEEKEQTPQIHETETVSKQAETTEESQPNEAQPKEQPKQEEQPKEPKDETKKQPTDSNTPSTKVEQPKVESKPTTSTVTKPPVVESKKQEQAQQPAPKKRTVTIAIRVDTLHKHWDLLDPSLQSEQYVPKDGFVLKPTTYELLSENETVWDVLQRATKEHKIQMEYQGANENVYSSVYVEGINHLYEFSAGELSGWMYQVNGNYPNYGCSQYVLKDGDVIEWHYTVDLGRDLGQQWEGS